LDRISSVTEFLGTQLLDGSLADSAAEHLVLQLGVDSSSYNQIDLNAEIDLTEVSSSALSLGDSNLNTQGGAFLALNDLTVALKGLIDNRAKVGSVETRLTSALNNINSQIENLTAAVSTIRDADIAYELTNLTKNQILVQAGASMLGQANLIPQAVLTLFEGIQ
jgi:flagellin